MIYCRQYFTQHERQQRGIDVNAWTMDATEGFEQADLDEINAAKAALMEANPGVDESNIDDLLNNHWHGGATAANLIEAVLARL